jgi:hypothetical protein
MKSYRKELWFNVPERRAFINITPQVDACLRESGIREGLALVNAMNFTPRIFINDAAGPQAGCTTAPARNVPRESREQRRRAPEAERNSRSCASWDAKSWSP